MGQEFSLLCSRILVFPLSEELNVCHQMCSVWIAVSYNSLFIFSLALLHPSDVLLVETGQGTLLVFGTCLSVFHAMAMHLDGK